MKYCKYCNREIAFGNTCSSCEAKRPAMKEFLKQCKIIKKAVYGDGYIEDEIEENL